MDDTKKELLKQVFWDMNELSSFTSTVPGEGENEEDTTTLHITVTAKTADEMADVYGFNTDQRQQLAELLSDEYRELWSAVLYGIGTGSGEIVAVALSQVGNVGGQPYWSWYGFGSRVNWCAIFVSWCANECGYIDAGGDPQVRGLCAGLSLVQGAGTVAGSQLHTKSRGCNFLRLERSGRLLRATGQKLSEIIAAGGYTDLLVLYNVSGFAEDISIAKLIN